MNKFKITPFDPTVDMLKAGSAVRTASSTPRMDETWQAMWEMAPEISPPKTVDQLMELIEEYVQSCLDLECENSEYGTVDKSTQDDVYQTSENLFAAVLSLINERDQLLEIVNNKNIQQK